MSKNSQPSRTTVQASEQGHSEDTATALWLGLALFFFYLLTTSGHPPYSDEAHYAIVAENILTRGRPVLTEQMQRQADGQIRNVITYSWLPLGQSLLILPFAAIELITHEVLPAALSFIPHLVINSLPAAESAATCALLFLLIRLLGRFQPELRLSPGTALAVALTTALATQMWPASRTLFADNSTTLLLTFAIYSLVRFRYLDIGPGWALSAAWAAALAVLFKNNFILASPALAAYGLWAVIERKRKRAASDSSLFYLILMAALPLVLVAITQLWFNHLRYGSIWLSGYHEDRRGEFGFSTPLLAGLYGILLSSGRSLFLYSPSCLLAFFGVRNFLTWAPAETGLIAGASLPLLFTYAKLWSWDGGWEWGNRYHLFLIPLLTLLSIPAWRWMDQRLLPAAVRRVHQTSLMLLIAVSIYVQGLGLLIHPAAYWRMAAANEMSVAVHRSYEKGVWDIRDNQLLLHFAPEFSPLAAHHWLIWATWNRSRLDDRALAVHAPWYSLNPKWAPKNVRPYLGFDLWFLTEWLTEEGSTIYAIMIVGLFAAMVGLCAIKLRSSIDYSP